MNTKEIRQELKKLGIAQAIVCDAMYDGTPCVLLRWNGAEEYVSGIHFISEEMDDEDVAYLSWLMSEYSDINIAMRGRLARDSIGEK